MFGQRIESHVILNGDYLNRIMPPLYIFKKNQYPGHPAPMESMLHEDQWTLNQCGLAFVTALATLARLIVPAAVWAKINHDVGSNCALTQGATHERRSNFTTHLVFIAPGRGIPHSWTQQRHLAASPYSRESPRRGR